MAKKKRQKRPRRVWGAKPGAHFNDEQAQVIGETLESLPEGERKPETVVDLARDPQHPLHPFFTWDDTEAAERYRRAQARHMIGHLKVRIMLQGRAEEVRAFESVRIMVRDEDGEEQDLGRSYVTFEETRQSPDYQRQVVAAAHRSLLHFQQRYAQLWRFFPDVFEAIDALPAEVGATVKTAPVEQPEA